MNITPVVRILPRRPRLQCLHAARKPITPRHHLIRSQSLQCYVSTKDDSPSSNNNDKKAASKNETHYARMLGDWSEDVEKPIRNPLDRINNGRQFDAFRKASIGRMKMYMAGMIACIAMTFLLTKMTPIEDIEAVHLQKKKNEESARRRGNVVERTDASDEANDRFQGKKVVVAPGGAKLVAHDERSGRDIELIHTGTSTLPHFPKTIRLPVSGFGNEEDCEYTLLGLGVRTVSFLGIEVYVVGLYVQTSSLAALQARLVKLINPIGSALIPGEKAELRKRLLDPEASAQVWNTLLTEKDTAFNTAVRVVPVKNTDFGHLRDGWVRGITAKAKEAEQKGELSPADDTFGAANKEFQGLFRGRGKAPKGSVLILARDSKGALDLLYQEKADKSEVVHLGAIGDERIARYIWLGYLGGKNVSSEPARKSVVDGVLDLVERPVGTIETKVD
ncbi:chalcone isomerase [Aulographum hederae CBS 113979]|uniref:Chalcone isomerase n=1 Tax=Aulographum hederae CBS 113979 TaxID=1176131 RepID=A0A6G1H141_9PEZI|nr:chalcone isomerase [Aulographum hederae CBS 113979]